MPPKCKTCGLHHYGYQPHEKGEEYAAEAAARRNSDDANISIARFRGPGEYHAMTGFGTNNAPKTGVLLKTGRLTYPSGEEVER